MVLINKLNSSTFSNTFVVYVLCIHMGVSKILLQLIFSMQLLGPLKTPLKLFHLISLSAY